jgi:hypothetical protein
MAPKRVAEHATVSPAQRFFFSALVILFSAAAPVEERARMPHFLVPRFPALAFGDVKKVRPCKPRPATRARRAIAHAQTSNRRSKGVSAGHEARMNRVRW